MRFPAFESLALLAVFPILTTSCQNNSPVANGTGAQVMMDFTRPGSIYDAPFPSDDLRRDDGSIDLHAFPNPDKIDLISQALTLLADQKGFSTSSAIFLRITDVIDTSGLPDLASSMTGDSKVFLQKINPGDSTANRAPVKVAFMAEGGPFGASNQLSLLPLQGIPLAPNSLYAAVIRTSLHDVTGNSLAQSQQMQALVKGQKPDGMSDAAFASYKQALGALAQSGTASSDIAGLAVFTTGDPTAEFKRAVMQTALSEPLAPDSPPVANEVFPDYCVYSTTITMPDYQSGQPPFSKMGGAWQFDKSGKLLVQRMEKAHLVFTIPRRPMPADGYPITILVRTGAGGDRPLVDRGTQAVHNGPSAVAGTGPGLYFALAGFAGVQIDGPLGGLRNTTNGDEQFLTFNVFNAAALRDNVRESALELVQFANSLGALRFDASACPSVGNTPIKFDTKHMAMMGHSMGASISPLAVAGQPQFRALILSGSGGSYIENVVYKKEPLDVKPLAEIILNYDSYQRDVTENDPALSLVQWAAEPSDSQVYAPLIISQGTHVLMEQGIVDHYIMPPIADASSLPLGLDLAGTALDELSTEVGTLAPLTPLLVYSHRSKITLPTQGNLADGKTTGLVIQHTADGIEDGHEVAFQLDGPKHQYKCFLESSLVGVPKVPADGAADAACQ